MDLSAVSLYNRVIAQAAEKFMRLLAGKKPENCKLIVSSHNYENTPSAEELADLVAQIQATGADIVKIATTATEIVDVARMFQTLVHCQVSLPSQSFQVLYMQVLVCEFPFVFTVQSTLPFFIESLLRVTKIMQSMCRLL